LFVRKLIFFLYSQTCITVSVCCQIKLHVYFSNTCFQRSKDTKNGWHAVVLSNCHQAVALYISFIGNTDRQKIFFFSNLDINIWECTVFSKRRSIETGLTVFVLYYCSVFVLFLRFWHVIKCTTLSTLYLLWKLGVIFLEYIWNLWN
jgi:hypothetical protein